MDKDDLLEGLKVSRKRRPVKSGSAASSNGSARKNGRRKMQFVDFSGEKKRNLEFNLQSEVIQDIVAAYLNAIGHIKDTERVYEIQIAGLPDKGAVPIKIKYVKEVQQKKNGKEEEKL